MTRRRRRARGLALVATMLAAAACNALNGSQDRTLADDATITTPREAGDEAIGSSDAGMNDTSVPTSPDGSDDATTMITIPIDLTQSSTLNDASFGTKGGLSITNYDLTHPIVMLKPSMPIPSDDFTLYATIRAPIDGEFGILTRIQSDGNGYIFGSEFSTSHRAFFGLVGPTQWNPADDVNSTVTWMFAANHEYVFMLRAVGNQLSGKMWDPMIQTEPSTPQISGTINYSTGRGIGFYVYENGVLNTALLENAHVTVP